MLSGFSILFQGSDSEIGVGIVCWDLIQVGVPSATSTNVGLVCWDSGWDPRLFLIRIIVWGRPSGVISIETNAQCMRFAMRWLARGRA